MRAPDLIEEFGPETARRLAELYGGCQERIPTIRMVDVYLRNSAILMAWRMCHPQADIAEMVGVSLAVVRGVIAAEKKLRKAGH